MYVAMATRRYGEGNIIVHTDRISGVNTGHGENTIQFWRGVLEFCTNKNTHDTLSVGVIDNLGLEETFHSIGSITGVVVKTISLPYISLHGLGEFDCLYVSGLSSDISSDVLNLITHFVDHGGGLVIEDPNLAGNINLLENIDSVEVTSIQPPVLSNGYWTIAGKSHYTFDVNAKVTFMVELLETSFSSSWTILITEIEVDDSVEDNYEEALVSFEANTSAEVSVSFIVGMQKGVVIITES